MSLLKKQYRTQEEYDQILAHLHKVQEQLEEYYLQLQEEQQHERAMQMREQQHKHALQMREQQYSHEINKLESKLRAANTRAERAEQAVLKQQQELDSIRRSTLWKTAKPIFALKRLAQQKNKLGDKLSQEINLLLSSKLFDAEWYLSHYPDVAKSNISPAEHYLLYGAAEGRQPSAHFDGKWYLEQHPDVATAGLNPLLHFILFGQEEGRSSGRQ